MKRIQLLLLLAVFFLSCSTNRPTNKSISNQNSKLKLILDSLDQELNSFKESTLIPGIALSIVNTQDIVFQKGYGYANLDQKEPFTVQTIQPIASISKTIVGVALMKLVDMGKINLDDKVNTFLPFKIVHPKFPDQAITIRHLATHTSSIGDIYGENGDSYWLVEQQPYKKGRDSRGHVSIFKYNQ